MSKKLSDYCKVANGAEDFVGLNLENNEPLIIFPIGFNLSSEDDRLRKEILNLFYILERYGDKNYDNFKINSKDTEQFLNFPFKAYLNVMSYYLNYGYYKEINSKYISSLQGKINWNRTIKKERPIITNTNILFLNFQTLKNNEFNEVVLTYINKFCVYESFLKIGWLFGYPLPQNPNIQANAEIFSSILQNKLSKTNKDIEKQLFTSMLDILNFESSPSDLNNKIFGTKKFENIWEKIIDKVFGIKNKSEYLPKTYWKLLNKDKENSKLIPDTIMIYEDKIFILDAKYYKYGMTHNSNNLPQSSDINKQISYGEYAFNKTKNKNIFNAFIMPFKHDNKRYDYIGYAFRDWDSGDNKFEKVQGILLDTKFIMNLSLKDKNNEIEKLANFIENNYKT